MSQHPSNFTFLPPALKDLAEASRKSEEYVMVDPRAACFHARFAALQHRSFRGEL